MNPRQTLPPIKIPKMGEFSNSGSRYSKGTISTVTVNTISLKCCLKLASLGPEMTRITVAHLHLLQNTEMVDRDPLACPSLLPHTPLQFRDKTLTHAKPASIFCSNLLNSTSFAFYLLGQEKKNNKTTAMRRPQTFWHIKRDLNYIKLLQYNHREMSRRQIHKCPLNFDGFVLWQKPCGGKGIYILLCLNSQDAKTVLKWFASTMAIGYHASFNASCILLQERFL